MQLRLVILSLTSLLIGSVLDARSGGVQPSTVARIQQAWKEREKNVTTLDCQWIGEATYAAKTRQLYDPANKLHALPLSDLTQAVNGRFRLHGDKMRFESVGPQAVQETLSFESREYLCVTDGDAQKSFFDKEKAKGDPRFPPIGFVHPTEKLSELRMIHLWPVLALYRPSLGAFGEIIDLSKFSSKGNISISGRECELFERYDGSGSKLELAIDQSRDFVPVRVREIRRDSSGSDAPWAPSYLMENQFAEDGVGGWELIGWKTVLFGEGGKLVEQVKAQVVRCALNEEIPDSVFHFDFPPGTIVNDRKTNETYLLREGGRKRPITPAEMNAWVPYKQLLETEPGGGLGYRRNFWMVAALVTGIGLLVLLARQVYKHRQLASRP